MACDACIVDRQCGGEQKDACKGYRYPVDAPHPCDEKPDADQIAPYVECYQIKPSDGNAVVAEAACDADRHQHQKRQYQQRKVACDAVVPCPVPGHTCRIKVKLDGDAPCHEDCDEPGHPSGGEFPFYQYLKGVGIKHNQVACHKRKEKIVDGLDLKVFG